MTHKITSLSVAILSILIVGGSQITQADAATDQQTEENKTNDVVNEDSDTKDTDTSKDDTDDQVAEGIFNHYHGGAHWKMDNGTLTLDSGELSEHTFTYAGDPDYFDTYMIDHNNDIKTIKIGKGMSLSAAPGQPFTCLINLEHIDGLSNLDTTNTVSVTKLFSDCSGLKSLDLSGFDTSGITNMNMLFGYDRKLTSVNLSGMDTSKVTNMSDMFLGCSSLESIDISSFDTSKVTNMESMFSVCKALTDLNLSGMDTSNVTTMSGIFANCEALTKLDVSKLNTKNVTNMGGMFSDDHNLKKIDVSNFDTSNVTDMSKMFWNDTSLEDLNISSFDVSNTTDIASMFLNTSKLKNMKVSNDFNELSEIIDESGLEDKTWINVGTGTENNPKPSEKLSFEKWSNLPSEERDNWFIETDTPYPSTNGYTVNVKNNLDKELTVEVPENDWPEYIGSTFKVAVPKVEGYVATEEYITVTATENGLISDDIVHYVADTEEPGTEEPGTEEPGDNNNGNNSGNNNNNSNNNNSGNEGNGDNEENEVEHKQNLVTVHPDKEYANLYDSKGKLVENRALAGNSNWQSDQLVTIKGNKYYRVASNEYVKAEDSYTYEVFDNAVKTKDTEITYMIKSTDKEVQNRGLGNQSSWKADKKVNINGKVYYRVATNEFVGADDTDII